MFNKMHFWNDLVRNVFNDLSKWNNILGMLGMFNLFNMLIDVYIQNVVLVSKWYLIISNVQYVILFMNVS